MSKLVYCIRHGLSQHNTNYLKYGVSTFYDPNFTDTELLPEGLQQATELRESWYELKNIELVIVSPLRRTLATAREIFKDIDVPMIALDFVREYPLGLQTCNKRSAKEYLMKEYPKVNFDSLQTNYDELWYPEREETIEELDSRILEFKDFLNTRSETKIAFVNHSSFIGKMKDNEIKNLENGQEELKHCFPYLLKL